MIRLQRLTLEQHYRFLQASILSVTVRTREATLAPLNSCLFTATFRLVKLCSDVADQDTVSS